MSEQEWGELYAALSTAIKASGSESGAPETDWFILMAAQRIAHTRQMALKYPEYAA